MLDFEEFLADRNERLEAAARDMADAFLSGTLPQECATSVVWEILDASESILSSHGIHTCYPGFIGEEEIPCYLFDECEGKCDYAKMTDGNCEKRRGFPDIS